MNNLFGLYPIGSRMYAFLLNACHSVERSARAEFPMCASNKSFDAENLVPVFFFQKEEKCTDLLNLYWCYDIKYELYEKGNSRHR